MYERELQETVVSIAQMYGWRVYHTYDSRRSEPGFPDLVLCHRLGGTFFVELKSDRGRVTKPQQEWVDDLVASGAEAYVWRPDDLDAIRARLSRHARLVNVLR